MQAQSGDRTFKNFIFEEETTQATAVIKYQLQPHEIVSLKPVLKLLPLQLERCRFKIYNFGKNTYESIDQIANRIEGPKYTVPWDCVKGEVVLLKYFEVSKTQLEYRDDVSQSQSAKKERSRERTISQVLAIVKQWRQIHLNQCGRPQNMHPGRKINLQQAAAMIGISKKSLDDYYYQLRLGEKYGFDFKQHMEEKIGVLRMFIKDIKPKGRKMDRNQKHPKRLKILDQLPDIDSLSSQRSRSYKTSSQDPCDNIRDRQKNRSTNHNNSGEGAEQYGGNNYDNFGFDQQSQVRNPFNPFKTDVPRSIEDQFYNDFEFMLNQPHDPFLALGNNYTNQMLGTNMFSKKNHVTLQQPCKMQTQENEEKMKIHQLNGFVNENENDYFFG